MHFFQLYHLTVSFITVIVRGLPSSASWQDLKVTFMSNAYSFFYYVAAFLTRIKCKFFSQDHMRKAGDVCFAEVARDSKGMTV